jgi:GntR family transcriptional regulator, rspAB operon transcriptional repressor
MTSKKTDVYAALRRSIIAGEIKQNEIINEGEIAQRHGVSRTPVREALLLLVADGLLTALPRAGYLVTPITIQDVQEAFHLRELLEVEAVRLASTRISPTDLDILEKTKIGIPATLNPQFNREFHLTIARASGSGRLARLIDQLLDEMERILVYDPFISGPHTPDEHQRILDGLRFGDAEAAQMAMFSHLRAVKGRVLERFQ